MIHTSLTSMALPYLINLFLISSSFFFPEAFGCYTSIFSFGDSITDTGNLYFSSYNSSFHFFFPPYGQTFFHHPTGRCSDGRLIIDFIAEFLELPYVRPYLQVKGSNASPLNIQGGVNFAVIGATAMDAAFLAEMGDENDYTNSSLGTQLDWFKDLLPSLCNSSSNCNGLLNNSLVLVGEIGGNDYNDALLAGKSIEQVQTYVPMVMREISKTIYELIELGATILLVPGNFPIGCLPIYLTKFQTSDKDQYNSTTGCLNWLNKFTEYHNDQLQIELSRIQSLHPNINIIYADYYNAVMQFYQSPQEFGFIGRTVEACCGGGGPYNYNSSAQCGTMEANSCENPSEFINWDGIHFTEATYRWIVKGLFTAKNNVGSLVPCVFPKSNDI